MNVDNLPQTPGVYIMKDSRKTILYVGKARNLRDRVGWYFKNTEVLEGKTRQLISQVHSLETIQTVSEFDALLLEASLIRQYKPKYNIVWRDDKHPLYIKITTSEEFPKVMTTRREEDHTSTYFGPFPSSRITRDVLRNLRRIFPYCTQKTNNRRCFYTHIGLCNPCPGGIRALPQAQRSREKRRYRQSLRSLVTVLSGRADRVVLELEKQMQRLAQTEQFEEANRVKRQIDYLAYISQRRFDTRNYLTNPNLLHDVWINEVDQLLRFLKSITTQLSLPYQFPAKITRLEAIDIANISGYHAVGSLVVFIDGEAAREWYRRFRVRGFTTPNDPGMMKEIYSRRLNHSEWPLPQLLIVDGGKTQVAAIAALFREKGVSLPFIGLAKRFEEVVIPQENNKFLVKRLPFSAPYRNVLLRIRDEAHRFANTYFHLLKQQNLLTKNVTR